MASSSSNPRVRSVAELARYLGLSDWTVSRAINGHPAVKASTRERVLATMREVGFQPDPMARALRGKVSGLIGICFGELHNTILIEKLAYLEAFLHEHGMRSILAFTGNDSAAEARAVEDFKRLRVEGIVLAQSHLTPELGAKLLAGQEHIFVDPIEEQPGPSISLDRNWGMELLVEHLAALGHRRFGLLGIPEANIWRRPGFYRALEKLGLEVATHAVFYDYPPSCSSPFEAGVRMAQQVLASPNPPTALLALSDRVAVTVIAHLRAHGAQVPGDFSVTGFDHLEMGRWLPPSITTIDQQPQRLMRSAGEVLVEKLRQSPGTAQPQKRFVEPVLVIGDSTGPVA